MDEEVVETPVLNNSKPKSKFLMIGVLLIAVIVGLLIFNKKELRPISLDEIGTHNSKDSCWTAINGGVYDVTKFISSHKGGDKILNACGVDATDFFTGKHPTIGRVHSEMATKLLGGMKIGNLQ